MKHIMVGLTAALILMISQTSTASGHSSTSKRIITIELPATIAIKNVSVHANIPRIPKYKILRSNPYKTTHRIIDDSDDDFIDDDGLITPYRRQDLTKIEHPEGISEDMQWKLFLARQLALAKYRSIHG